MTHPQRERLFVQSFGAFTIVLWAWFVIEFVTRGAAHVPGALAELYLLILVFYAGDKELHRWHHRHAPSRRRGEAFVYGWVVTGLAMLLIERIGGARWNYVVPQDVGLVVWSVVVIYVITEFLKREFHRRQP